MTVPKADTSVESRPDTSRRTRLWLNWLLAVDIAVLAAMFS